MDNQMVWSVYNLIRTVPGGVVEVVCCRVSLTEGQYSSVTEFSQRVPFKDPSDPGFIPFDQLTEEETIQWVQDKLGPIRVDAIQKGLQQDINRQKVPTAQGVPW
jgi:hypothetical protein